MDQHRRGLAADTCRRLGAVLALAAALLAGLAACGGNGDECANCATTEGGRLQGVVENGVVAFKGIPYAAPPVGALRFSPPQPAAPWTGTRDARSLSAPCAQLADAVEAYAAAPTLLENPLTGRPTAVFENEDCLYLNVWTPLADRGKRPVMVYIHGGAFITGTAANDIYTGKYLAAKDAVVVAINYRLGSFGFLELGSLDPTLSGSGNNGLRDQIAALRWVKRNAAAFGGDPDNITVFGESAGSMSISALLATKDPHTLFRRAIAQSGGPNLLHTRAFQLESAAMFTSGSYGPLVSAEALKAASTRDILMQQEVALQTYELGASFYAAYVDGDVVLKDPNAALAEGSAKNVDLMVGATQDEMGYWSVYSLDLNNMFVQDWTPAPGVTLPPVHLISPANRAVIEVGLGGTTLDAIYTDWVSANNPPRGNRDLAQTVELTQDHDFMMILPMTRMAEQQVAHNANTWVYRFQWRVPGQFFSSAAQDVGSTHALELPFMFGTLLFNDALAPGSSAMMNSTAQMANARTLASQMVDAWVNFARSGNPNGGAVPAWPRYELTSRPTMAWRNAVDGSISTAVVNDPDASRRQAWEGWAFPQYPWTGP